MDDDREAVLAALRETLKADAYARAEVPDVPVPEALETPEDPDSQAMNGFGPDLNDDYDEYDARAMTHDNPTLTEWLREHDIIMSNPRTDLERLEFDREQQNQDVEDLLRMFEFVPDPADPEDVARLELKTLEADFEEYRCCICLEDQLQGETYLDFVCGHVMHAACSGKWFEYGKTCPLCRATPWRENDRAETFSSSSFAKAMDKEQDPEILGVMLHDISWEEGLKPNEQDELDALRRNVIAEWYAKGISKPALVKSSEEFYQLKEFVDAHKAQLGGAKKRVTKKPAAKKPAAKKPAAKKPAAKKPAAKKPAAKKPAAKKPAAKKPAAKKPAAKK